MLLPSKRLLVSEIGSQWPDLLGLNGFKFVVEYLANEQVLRTVKFFEFELFLKEIRKLTEIQQTILWRKHFIFLSTNLISETRQRNEN